MNIEQIREAITEALSESGCELIDLDVIDSGHDSSTVIVTIKRSDARPVNCFYYVSETGEALRI